MVTRNQFSTLEMRKSSPVFSCTKTIVETAFYENQVHLIKTLEEAYQLASNVAGTVILDMPVIHTKELGLPSMLVCCKLWSSSWMNSESPSNFWAR